jgi:DNA-binding NtrC family response regulator
MAELDGNKPEVAKRLGIGLTTLYRKLQEYGLE